MPAHHHPPKTYLDSPTTTPPTHEKCFELWVLQPLSLYKMVCDVLRDLAPLVQFKKREKHPWRSVTFSKVEGF